MVTRYQMNKIKIIFYISLFFLVAYTPRDVGIMMAKEWDGVFVTYSLIMNFCLGAFFGLFLSRYFYYEIGDSYFAISYFKWKVYYSLSSKDKVVFEKNEIIVYLDPEKLTIRHKNNLTKKRKDLLQKYILSCENSNIINQFSVKN